MRAARIADFAHRAGSGMMRVEHRRLELQEVPLDLMVIHPFPNPLVPPPVVSLPTRCTRPHRHSTFHPSLPSVVQSGWNGGGMR